MTAAGLGTDGSSAAPNPLIRGLATDSRAVAEGYLFAAFPGLAADGRAFIADAMRRGAVAVLAPAGTVLPTPPPGAGVPVALLAADNPRRALSLMAARFFAAQPRIACAVTGTNGKTSVAWFTRALWTALGRSAASLGTLGLQTPGRAETSALTTPDTVSLHRMLAGLAAEGIDHLVLEASSHGLDQCRIDGVALSAGAFTNLSRDHLDYHATFAAYRAAKRRLFETLLPAGAAAVLNADSPEFESLAQLCRERGLRVLDYGRAAREIRLEQRVARRDGQSLTIVIDGTHHQVELPLIGEFQAANALCALGLVIAGGEDAGEAVAALAGLGGVPGRLERVATAPDGGAVYVDYAHTPDALDVALSAVRPHVAGRLVVVFGCGGDRDRGKRPVMGEIARLRADQVIVTDDNPRSEDPAAIRREILACCAGAAEIGDRAQAIGAGIALLGPDDALVIAGKGHETGQIVGTIVRPFNDARIARAAVAGEPVR